MTDRELLELAAKAAGIHIGPDSPWSGYSDRDGFYTTNMDGSAVTWRWNPLTDDGDALRLACDLCLQVYPVARTSSGTACSAVASVTGTRLSEIADQMHETRSATRRAIVRAAAEIGKGMK